MPDNKWTERAKKELANKDSSLADVARAAVSAGGASGAIGAAMQMMGFGGGGPTPEQDIQKKTGIDTSASGEGAVIKTFVRRLGVTRDEKSQSVLPDKGADYLAVVKGMADLLHPSDQPKRDEALEAIRGVFKRLVEGKESFDAAYGDFSARVLDGKPGWKEARAQAYERFVPFAAEMRAMKTCCEDAIAAGQLTSRDSLAVSVNAWDRDATKLAEALRMTGKTAMLDVIAFPAETVIGALAAAAEPFADRKKPGIEQIAKEIIAEKEAPKGPDLTELKKLVSEQFPGKRGIEEFMKDISGDETFSGAQRKSHANELVKEVAKVKEEITKVESGKAANLGALTTAVEVLSKHTARLIGAARDNFVKFDFPKDEPLPADTGVKSIDATIALEKFSAGLEAQKTTLASARGVAE